MAVRWLASTEMPPAVMASWEPVNDGVNEHGRFKPRATLLAPESVSALKPGCSAATDVYEPPSWPVVQDSCV
jgi:predicted secreted Zn-dependent protease